MNEAWFQNWIYSSFRFGDFIYNLCTINVEDNLNDGASQKLDVLICSSIFVLCDGGE